jgi:hypothetical protein
LRGDIGAVYHASEPPLHPLLDYNFRRLLLHDNR